MAEQFSTNGDRVTPVFDLSLANRVQAMRVDYEPGGTTPWPHRHPFGAFVYVIEGAVRMGLEGEATQVLRAGDSFYEPPGLVHALSENASDTQPASLLAVFVLPEGQEPAVPA
jgi:quercetin dioxygenase-like cupin family protein